jgi:hypothetical protein
VLAVAVERHGDRGVTCESLDTLGVRDCLRPDRDAGVPGLVERHGLEAGAKPSRSRAARDARVGERLAVGLAEDEDGSVAVTLGGSVAKQITHAVNAGNPDWSPNGETIVAEMERAQGGGIWLMAPDGGRARNLTPKGEQGQPAFSPDAHWIAYERDVADGNNGI